MLHRAKWRQEDILDGIIMTDETKIHYNDTKRMWESSVFETL